MKIIDSHVHCGKIASFDMPMQTIDGMMAERGVASAIISNIENAETTGDKRFKPLPAHSTEINARLLEQIAGRQGLFMQYWIRPALEEMSGRTARFIEGNRAKIVGLKIHPFMSAMRVDDVRMRPYLEYAQEQGLPVAVHTAAGYGCECRYLADVCARYPKANFVAVHMDLGTDHAEAVGFVNSLPNLYGDVSWIPYAEYKKLGVDPEKVLFGSDIPINMQTGYDFYGGYFKNAEREELLMHRNAEKLFRLQ